MSATGWLVFKVMVREGMKTNVPVRLSAIVI